MSGQALEPKDSKSSIGAGIRASFAARFAALRGAEPKLANTSGEANSVRTMSHTATLRGGVTGLYGKVPSMGDFVSRRLPKPVIDEWDKWLQECFLVSRERLSGAWLSLYLGMPMWRFCLPPSVLSNHTWLGVLVPSVDRVGRYFPLTLACSVEGGYPNLAATFAAAAPWFASAEAAALEALRPHAVFDEVDHALVAVPAPHAVPQADLSDQTMPLPRSRSVAAMREVGGAWGDAAFLAELEAACAAVPPPTCIWSAVGEGGEPHTLLLTERLPKARHFAALLDGRWETHGWQVR